MKSVLTACAFLVAFGGVAAPAALAETRSQAIRVSDLDLSRPSDVTKLAKRINRAANEICNQSKVDDGADAYKRDRACRIAAINRALTDINNPMLTARFDTQRMDKLASR